MFIFSALLHAFVPRESNSHRPRILHPLVIVLCLVLLLFINKASSESGESVLGFASQISPEEVIRLTNLKRAEAGKSQLTENTLLTKAAQEKAKDMFSKGYWAHTAPDGTQPWEFFKRVGYSYRYAGENLARDFSSPEAAINGWMASASHKENLLSDRYKEIGIGVSEGLLNGKDTTIIVQLFGAKSQPVKTTAIASDVDQSKALAPKPSQRPQFSSDDGQKKLNLSRQAILSQNIESKVSSIFTNKHLALLTIMFLSIALVFDLGVAWAKGAKPGRSSSFAQLSFLSIVALILIVAKAGEVL